MKKIFILIFIFLLLLGQKMSQTKIKLPQPVLRGKLTLEETLLKRRSIIKFKKRRFTIKLCFPTFIGCLWYN
jgi:hypothetical protein